MYPKNFHIFTSLLMLTQICLENYWKLPFCNLPSSPFRVMSFMDEPLRGLCAKGGKWRKIANSFIVKMKIDRHGQGHPNDEDDETTTNKFRDANYMFKCLINIDLLFIRGQPLGLCEDVTLLFRMSVYKRLSILRLFSNQHSY